MSFLGDFYLGGLHWKPPLASWIPSLNIAIIIITIIIIGNDSHIKTGLQLFKNLATPRKNIKHSKGKQ